MRELKLTIRLATFEDLDDVQTCAKEAYSKYLSRMDQAPAPMVADFSSQIGLGQVHVAFAESLFAGYIVFYQESDHLHLENMAVLPARSGKGIGKRLLQFVEQSARDLDLQAVELYTNEAMFENIVMYTKLGYVEIRRITENGFNRVYFRKYL